jgi:hypothetical protein
MEAYRIDRFGAVDGIVLMASEDPRTGPKEVLLRVRATSLNCRDLMVLKGGGRGPTKLGVVPRGPLLRACWRLAKQRPANGTNGEAWEHYQNREIIVPEQGIKSAHQGNSPPHQGSPRAVSTVLICRPATRALGIGGWRRLPMLFRIGWSKRGPRWPACAVPWPSSVARGGGLGGPTFQL